MRYRDFGYVVEQIGPVWKWTVRNEARDTALSGLAASAHTAALSAKLAIDKMAKLEAIEIEARLNSLNSLIESIDAHLRRIVALREHVCPHGKGHSQTRSDLSDNLYRPVELSGMQRSTF
jgi:hypothetical protein